MCYNFCYKFTFRGLFMEKFCRIFLSLFVCFFLFSCSDFQQDLASTTVEITPEFISKVRSATSDSDSDFYISVCMEFADGSIPKEQIISIENENSANGKIIVFDNLPIDKKGTISIYVINKLSEPESNKGFNVDKISVYEGKQEFIVKAGGQHLKIDVNKSTEYKANFLTFPNDDESPISYIELNFTEYSTITAPLPVGTTRWQIYHNDIGDVINLGDYGEKIDVAKDLIQHKDYFINSELGENDTAYFEATGNPMNQIKTPIVYSSFDSASASKYPYLYNFANSLDEVGGNANILFDPESEITDYCFDNAGNLYFIYYGGAYKLAYDFDTNSYESATIDGEFCNPFYSDSDISAQGITYDQAQNTLYLLGEKPNAPAEGEFVLVKFSNPAGTIYKESKVSQTGPTNFSLPTEGVETNSQSWTAHNGKIYVASVHKIENENGSSYNLVLQEYEYVEDSSSDTWTWTSGEDKIYPINVNNTNLNFTTDIMFQDGSLYVIFRCYNTYWSSGDNKNYSTGGILKYDISSPTFDSDFRIKGFATETSFDSTISEKTITIDYFAPTLKNETQVFYGPTKFVAIMPKTKKLVFLDQGASIDGYDYEQNDTKIPTKTRIVEYDLDLESDSFSSKEITSSDLEFILAITL